jgi:hypothetical protein
MTKFTRAARRAVATFVFATAALLVGNPVLNMDVAQWKLVLAAGIGSMINLAYRWAEGVVKEPQPVDQPGGDVNHGGI